MGEQIEQVVCLNFPISNNEAEYELIPIGWSSFSSHNHKSRNQKRFTSCRQTNLTRIWSLRRMHGSLPHFGRHLNRKIERMVYQMRTPRGKWVGWCTSRGCCYFANIRNYDIVNLSSSHSFHLTWTDKWVRPNGFVGAWPTKVSD